MPRQRLRWTRTPRQRAVLLINSGVVLCLAAGSVTLGYAAQKLGAVDRVDVANELSAPTQTTMFSADDITVLSPDRAADSITTTEPSEPPGPAENFLIVGSDNAEAIDPDDPLLNGRDSELANHLADTIMILRLEPETGRANLLSVPRDLEVEISGKNNRLKINAAFNYNEPYVDQVARLINTVEENLDITLQHYIEVDLAAFQRIVDAVGGVEVCFAGPTTNPRTGLNITRGGWQLLDGQTALQWVRSRNELVQQRLDGTWQNMSPSADLDRIERQQDFARQAVDQVLSDVVRNPSLLFSILDIAADELIVSNSFSVVGDGRLLSQWFRDLDDDDLATMSLDVFDHPVTAAHDNEYRLGMTALAEPQLDVFRGIPLEAVVPKRVEVSLQADEHGEVAAGLTEIGFEIGTEWFGSTGDEGVRVRYGIGGEDAANLLAAFLDYAVEFVADESLESHQVVLEWAGAAPEVLDVPRALTQAAEPIAPPTTTTVAPELTTTTTTVPEFAFDCDVARP